jgi:hypothetical protein
LSTNSKHIERQGHGYNIFIGGRGRGVAIGVGAIQAVVKKSNYLRNMLLGEFKNIAQYIISNKHTLNNHEYKCWGLTFAKIVSHESLYMTAV